MNPVLETRKMACAGSAWHDMDLHAGELAWWTVGTDAARQHVISVLTGVAPSGESEIRWFGAPFSAATERGRLAALCRMAVLPPDGALISNLRVWENILLPARHRRVATPAALLTELGEHCAALGLGAASFLAELPHSVGPFEREMASILRAALLRPEAVTISWPGRNLGPDARTRLVSACAWLRQQTPDAAWVVVAADAEMPDTFSQAKLIEEILR